MVYNNYILVVDYYSRYPEVVKLPTTTPRTIIGVLKRIFSRHGVPETLVSDNEPQYSSREFQDFASSYQFCHLTSSLHYAQSNGHAERAVQTVKKLLREAEDPNMALLTYRSTPFPWCGLSPAELLMGRRIRANMPLQKNLLIPDWKYQNHFHKRNQEFMDRQKNDFDCRHRTQSLPVLPDETDVGVTTGNQPIPGQIVTSTTTPRSYVVSTPSGEMRRNRSHLNPIPHSDSTTNKSDLSTATRVIQTRSRTGTAIHPP